MNDKNKKRNNTKEVENKADGSILRKSFRGSEKIDANKQQKGSLDTKRSLKWDETNIVATLHPIGKDYGHMKIDEPPTPYERSTSQDERGVDPKALAKRLEAVKQMSIASAGSDSDDEEEVEQERKKTFDKKRKAHYNEFLEAKRKLAELEDLDTDSDDDDYTAYKNK